MNTARIADLCEYIFHVTDRCYTATLASSEQEARDGYRANFHPERDDYLRWPLLDRRPW